jgi:hypothetical protein
MVNPRYRLQGNATELPLMLNLRWDDQTYRRAIVEIVPQIISFVNGWRGKNLLFCLDAAFMPGGDGAYFLPYCFRSGQWHPQSSIYSGDRPSVEVGKTG